MKIKNYFLCVIMGLSAVSSSAATKSEMVGLLLSTHANAFSGNLLSKKLDQKAVDAWNNAFSKASAFVKENSKNDSDLTKPLTLTTAANADLISGIKILYNKILSDKARTQQAREDNPLIISDSATIFEEVESKMIAATKKLKGATFIIDKAKKLEAREVLLQMMVSLEVIAKKALLEALDLSF